MSKIRHAGLVGLFVALASVGGSPAAGQVAWDAPMLLAPGSPAGLGVLLVEPGGRDSGVGVLGMWRRAAAPAGVGFRVGLAEDAFDELAVLGGIDLSGTLLAPTDDLPLGFMWLFGAGVGIGEEVLVSFPVGISIGADLNAEGILFRPYATPRVSLDVWSGPGDEIDLSGAVDLGLDLAFTSSWVIRFGASLGDREALAIGLTFPGASFD